MSTRAVSRHIRLIDAPYRGESGVLGTYLVKGKHSMVIDPGPMVSIPCVIQELDKNGIPPGLLKCVAPTHIHLDHAGGSWKLLKKYPEAKLLVHPRGARHMIDPTRLEAGARQLFGDQISNYGEIKGVPTEIVVESQDGRVIDLGGVTVRVTWTPGHASHHQCYHVPEDGVVILGTQGASSPSRLVLSCPRLRPRSTPSRRSKASMPSSPSNRK